MACGGGQLFGVCLLILVGCAAAAAAAGQGQGACNNRTGTQPNNK